MRTEVRPAVNGAGRRTVVIGLGNTIMGDDGVGLAALDMLRRRWLVPPSLQLVDGGTWGLNLLPVLESADRVLFLDAIDLGAPPGTLIELRDEQIPSYLAVKLSPHQIDLREVLALTRFRGTTPGELIALGLQPLHVELSTDLSPVVGRNIVRLVETAVERLARWGVRCTPRMIAHA